MKLLSLLLITFGSTLSAATVACPETATLQDYLDFGSEGCYIGYTIVSDFAFLPQPATNNPTASQLVVTTATSLLDAVDTLIIEDEDGTFTVATGEVINFFVDFNVTARAPETYLYEVALTSTAAETGNGNNARIRELVFSSPDLSQIAQMQINQGNSGTLEDRSFAPQTTIRISKEFDLFSQNHPDALASLGAVEQRFLLTPEPGTIPLVAGGLLLVAVGLAKRKKPSSSPVGRG